MDWEEYFTGFADWAAKKSKDLTQVGAALVDPDGVMCLTGFNGPPKGVVDLPERRERPAKYLFTSHAEENLINFAARKGIRTAGHSVFVTHFPCARCARSLIQAGIIRVIAGAGKTSMPQEEFAAARQMFLEAQVEVREIGATPPEPAVIRDCGTCLHSLVAGPSWGARRNPGCDACSPSLRNWTPR